MKRQVVLDPRKFAYGVRELKGLGLGGPTWAYGEINSGELPAKKLGSRTVILAEDLREYLENLPDYEVVDAAAGPKNVEPDPETVDPEPSTTTQSKRQQLAARRRGRHRNQQQDHTRPQCSC